MVCLGGSTSPTFSLAASKNATTFLQQLVGLHLVQSRNCQKQNAPYFFPIFVPFPPSSSHNEYIPPKVPPLHFHWSPPLESLVTTGLTVSADTHTESRHCNSMDVTLLRGRSFNRWWGHCSSALRTDWHKSRFLIKSTDCLLFCHLAFHCTMLSQFPKPPEPRAWQTIIWLII